MQFRQFLGELAATWVSRPSPTRSITVRVSSSDALMVNKLVFVGSTAQTSHHGNGDAETAVRRRSGHF
jgi:hypothetical protein